MKVLFKELRVSTTERVQLIDVTSDVERFIRDSGVRDGLCLVYAPHATVAMIANEQESGLLRDIIEKVKEDYPKGAGWSHDRIDDNASAHLASAFIGSSRIFPVRNGSLVRGTWQSIFLMELDGPRSSRVVVLEAIGE